MMQKTFELELECKDLDDGTMGGFKGYASTFGNVDHHNDIVTADAFANTMKRFKKEGAMPLLWQHKTDMPVGVIKKITQDEKGIIVEGEFVDTQLGRDARTNLKARSIRKMSIGCIIKKATYDEKKGTRYIDELDLHEVSLVTFPANEQAGILAVKKALPQTIRDFEAFLREKGFSKKEATAIALHGFNQRDAEGEAQEVKRDVSPLRDELLKLKHSLKGK